jgi:glycosyltransferase involved in cell wall biosynthesis
MSTDSINEIAGPEITILTTSFPRFEGDSAGRFICNFARELSSVRVIAPHDSAVVKDVHPFPVEHFRYFFPESCQSLVYGAGMASRLKGNALRIFQLPFLLGSFFLSALKSAGQTQIFHAYWTLAGLVAIAVKFFTATPVVINLWGSDILFTKLPVIWYLLCKTLNRADAIICESQHFADQLIAKGISRQLITVLPNGIDLEQFKPLDKMPLRKQLELPDDRPLIVTVGNLSARKGHQYLLTALPKILESCGPVQVVIVGEGEFRSATESMIAKLNLADHVFLTGFQTGKTIPHWLNAADIFVLPSLLEGTPNILLEAMACQLPVVATDVGGIGCVIEDGVNGLLIPPRSDTRLAEAVISLLQDPALRERLSAKAGNTVHSQYGSWKQQSAKLENIYSRILKPR